MMGPSIVSYLQIPHTYCWSPALVAKPGDWGSEIGTSLLYSVLLEKLRVQAPCESSTDTYQTRCLDVCGFFMRDEPTYSPPTDLAHFLSTGPAPLYVGFGSIVLEDPERLHSAVVEAARARGVRLIISRGWSKLGGDSASSDDVFYLGDCPHGKWTLRSLISNMMIFCNQSNRYQLAKSSRVAFQAGHGGHPSRRRRYDRLWAHQCKADVDSAIFWRVSFFAHRCPQALFFFSFVFFL